MTGAVRVTVNGSFDLEGRAAVVVRRADEFVAVIRLDDRAGRIFHLHTFTLPSLAC